MAPRLQDESKITRCDSRYGNVYEPGRQFGITKPSMLPIWAAVIVSFRDAAHYTVKNTESFKKVEKPRVFYAAEGTTTFEWSCTPGDILFWEVAQPSPWDSAPTVAISVAHNTDDLIVAEGTHISQDRSEIVTQGCAVLEHRDALTTEKIKVVARYGPALCNASNNDANSIVVSSAGNFAVLFGTKKQSIPRRLAIAPYHYVMTSGWAGWTNPWTDVGFFLILLVIASFWIKRMVIGLHGFILLTWIIFFVHDAIKVDYALKDEDPCVSSTIPDIEAGIAGTRRSDDIGSPPGLVFGIYVVRAVLTIIGIATIWVHNENKTKKIRPYVVAAALFVFGAGYVVSVGGGILPLILVVYYALDDDGQNTSGYIRGSKSGPVIWFVR